MTTRNSTNYELICRGYLPAPSAIAAGTLSEISSVTVSASSAADVQPLDKAEAKPRVKGKAQPEAKPYLEGKSETFSIRSRYKGHDIFPSG